jgi:transcriptional regulator with XRE-family HTH domain
MAEKSIYSNEYEVVTKRLREARESLGLTQSEVSVKLQKPQSYISKIERGERRIDIVELAKVAKLYKKNVEWFLN